MRNEKDFTSKSDWIIYFFARPDSAKRRHLRSCTAENKVQLQLYLDENCPKLDWTKSSNATASIIHASVKHEWILIAHRRLFGSGLCDNPSKLLIAFSGSKDKFTNKVNWRNRDILLRQIKQNNWGFWEIFLSLEFDKISTLNWKQEKK